MLGAGQSILYSLSCLFFKTNPMSQGWCPIPQRNRLKPGQVKCLARGHTAKKWWYTTPREVNAVRVPRKGCRTPGPLACPVFKAHFGDRDFPGPHMSGAEPPKDGGQRLFMTRPAQHSLANPPRPGDRSPAAQISPYLLESDMGTRSSHAGLFANLETKCPL